MSAKTGDTAGRGKRTGRRRSAVAAAGALLIVPVAVAGEPVAVPTVVDPTNLALARSAGGGLIGLTDPSEVSADGSLPDAGAIGADLLTEVSNPGVLAFGPGAPAGPLGIPGTMLDAYMRAAQSVNVALPGCHMEWSLLASIGRIESNHARGGRVNAQGDTAAPILGPVLNGGGFAAISDTDGGRYDGDNRWDRAVGPMQFIPSTWRGYASDGNGDGETNPNNIYDATLGSAKYLCSGGMDMANPANRAAAVFRYNHSDSYVRTVLTWADAYAKGVTPVPTTPVAQIERVGPPSPGPNPPASGVITPPVPVPTPTTTPAPTSSSTTTTQEPTSSTTTTAPTTDPTTTTTAPTCPTTPAPTTTTEPSPTADPTPDPCVPTTTTTAPTTTVEPTSTSGALGSAVPTATS